MQFFIDLLVGWFGVGFAIAALLLGAYFFMPQIPWLTTELRKRLLEAAIAVAVGTILYGYAFSNGYTDAIERIARNDQGAVDAKDKAINRVRGCAASGRVWDTSTGQCR